MGFYKQKLYLQLALLFVTAHSYAQGNWPTPEIEQMYRHAQEYTARGDFGNATTTYKQAISLAPGKVILFEELGNVYYLSGKYLEAEKTLTAICSNKDADAMCYQILAATQAAQANRKDAISTLKKGVVRFPRSGGLYYEQGKILFEEGKREASINAWLDGIARDPGYAPNYYEVALAYLPSKKVLWGLIYGEMFLDMKHDTVGDDLLKNKMFTGYKALFDGFAADEPPYSMPKAAKPVKNFEDAVLQVYAHLTPVVSDGITTENLTMVRARFLMDWFPSYGSKYPFSLFSYQDSLVKYGRFDIWNEWIFGKAENVPAYDAWNTFHEGAISRTLDWQATHEFHPSVPDNYDDRNMDGLFEKKKK